MRAAGIIDPMTDRGLPTADGSPACPFVAFEDDRDERADRPDHRHRCFAEAVPAPRALAHQEAYCLSSAFPVCPTFQDWARREAAHARPGRAATPPAARATRVTASVAEDEGAAASDEQGPTDDGSGELGAVGNPDEHADDAEEAWPTPEAPIEDRPRRNPPRDWAAPPPWAAGAGAAGAAAGLAPRTGRPGGGPDADIPEEGRGLAGSAADRLASGEDPDHAWLERAGRGPSEGPSAPPDPELANLVGRSAAAGDRDRARNTVQEEDAAVAPGRPVRRPTVSSTRDRSREREREREAAAAERGQHDGPSWERSRRYEAYPSIKARVSAPGMPQLPRVAVLFGALIVAALLVFLLPTLLNVGGKVDNGSGASASPSNAVASASVEPTPIPAPTPVTYTIKAGDTLNKIAKKFNVTVAAIEAANKDRIKDPNRIKVGDTIVIPTPPPAEVGGGEPSASPSPS